MRPEPWRGDRLKWQNRLWGLSALLAAGLAVFCLWQGQALQLRLDHAYVSSAASRQLAAPMAEAAGVRQLRPQLDALLTRRDLGLRFIAVRDAEGILLAQAGKLDALELPATLPVALRVRLHSALYSLLGSPGSSRVLSDDRRLLGSIDYNIRPGVVTGVRDEAVSALRMAGWLAAALSLPLALVFLLGARRERRRQPAWAGRADPLRQAAAAVQSLDLDEARSRVGVVLDTLDYGLIVADREALVRYVNATAERLTGWSAADAQGRLLYSIHHVVDPLGVPQPSPAEPVLQQGRSLPATVLNLRRRSGDVLPVEMMASPVRSALGAIEGVAVLLKDASNQQREVDTLRREARLSQAVVDHLDEGLLTTDTAGVVLSANARAERMFGYSRNELVGFTITKLMPVPFLNAPQIRITDYVAARRGAKLPKVVGWRKDATTFPVDLWVQPMRAEGSNGLVVVVRDISERLRGENLASRLGRLLDNAAEEVYIFDAQSLYFLEVNRGARNNLGYRAEALARMTPLDISEDLSDDGFSNYLAHLRGGDRDHLVYRCRHRRADGSSYPVEVRLNFSRDEEPPVFMAIAADISDRLAAEEKLNQLAHFDAVTGLPNRIMLYDRLRQAMLATQRDPRLLGVFFLDLDRFKQINDVHGHEVGDQVLKAVADRLASAMRPTDTIARLAGDEFVILAPGLRTPEDARFLAQKLLDRFAQPLDLPGLSITSRPSIGVTLYPLDDTDAEGLLRHADNAMYEAKAAGRGCFRLFTTELDPERSRRLDLEREIHAAVALNQFQLLMTPAVDADGAAQALLATLSWRHPRHGEVGQIEALQAAGRAGLVGDLELWQICQICEYLVAARAQDLPQLPCIVAISGWQLRDREFISHVVELLQRYEVPGDRLVLGLSPDGLVEAGDRHADAAQLLSQGLRFALRDFNVFPEVDGRLPLAYALIGAEQLDAVLDRLPAERDIALIARSVVDEAQRRRCAAAGIDYVSGAIVGEMLDTDALFAWLKKRQKKQAG